MNHINFYRKKANITQQTLAESMGVTQGVISQWEKGTTTPKSEKLPKLAAVLHCTIDELLKSE